MPQEPDWNTLNEINYLIQRRMAEHLNAALAAISLMGSPEALEQPAEFWQARGETEVLRALNLYNAWASLIRYKQGEHFMPQHMRQFRAGELLQVMAAELQLSSIDLPERDDLLSGNRETLQEGLLLLYSCATVLGPNVRLVAQAGNEGMWFSVRYNALKAQPPSLEALFEALNRNWRLQSAAFELARAHDFLAMNNCELRYAVQNGYCELGFFVPAVGRQGAAGSRSQVRLGDEMTTDGDTIIVHHNDVTPSRADAQVRGAMLPLDSTEADARSGSVRG